MNYLSVCSGIEAATVAWEPLGWKAVGFSEIEPFPCAVLAHHYPDVTNYGDLTKHEQWNIEPGTVDVLIGGTPCQSFSVAGLRKGLADPRGNLALVYLALVDRIRPRYVVWENVPGVLSSNKGRDFGAFLGALAELGYGFAYRVLDAEYWGVAQRRRRVFVVGCLDGWQRAASVLFERESCTRNTPARPTVSGKPTAPSGNRVAFDDTARYLTRGGNQRLDFKTEDFVVVSYGIEPGAARRLGGCYTEECSGTLRREMGDNQSSVAQTITKNNAGNVATAGNNGGTVDAIVQNGFVRRLTPTECERLQGFPDSYSDIVFRGKPALDCHRYRALGNSMAVPVIRWIGERIQAVDEIPNNPRTEQEKLEFDKLTAR